MFNPAAYENSRAGGIGVLEVKPEEEGGAPQFVPLRRSELHGEIVGPLAALRLVQAYGYTREQSDKTLEALYRFPLPGDAAVRRVRVRFGDVEIEAELKEREQAETEYAEAKEQGFQAVLATRESPDVFTLQVAGIKPDEEILVQTDYVQLARPEGAGWMLRVPLTTAPRYVRSDEVNSRHAEGQPLALLRDPGHRFSLSLQLPGAGEASSPTHPLAVQGSERGLRVSLEGGEVLPDRDFVLRWAAAQQPGHPTLHTLLHHERAQGQLYFMALVAPPATHEGRQIPREVILLVDHSGSMDGAKWEAADWTVERFLSDLTPQDSFNLGLFHNTTRWFAPEPRRADAGAVSEAIAFLKANRDMGGTELGVALEQALSMPRQQMPSRHVLIVTDAEVSDAGRILRLADEEAGPEQRRISVICIDAAPNAFLANELAERGGGVARFLTSDPEQEDITTALDEVLADWAEPILANLRLELNRPTIETTRRRTLPGSEAGWQAIDLGDMPAGRALWVAGRVPYAEGEPLALRLMGQQGRLVAEATATLEGAMESPALKALFGARRILGLEYLMNSMHSGDELHEQLRRLGYDPESALQPGGKKKLYAENVREDAQGALKGLLVREALDYGLASAESAFIAVRREQGQPVEGRVVVANALPSGWTDRFATGGGGRRMRRTGGMHFTAAAMPMASPPPSPNVMRGDREEDAPKKRSPFDKLSEAVSGLLRQTTGMSEPEPMEMEEEKAEVGPIHERQPSATLFAGVPALTDGEAILFDAGDLPAPVTFKRLRLRFPQGGPDSAGRELALLLFVGDLSLPRARVRVADLLRSGERPLNIARKAGEPVRLLLADPQGEWRDAPPAIEVDLEW